MADKINWNSTTWDVPGTYKEPYRNKRSYSHIPLAKSFLLYGHKPSVKKKMLQYIIDTNGKCDRIRDCKTCPIKNECALKEGESFLLKESAKVEVAREKLCEMCEKELFCD